jgi:hypothetical protein
VVAVDDGSRDGSGALLAAHARRDPRLRVLATAARGLVPALNLALCEARAPLVARMDADDLAHRERLETQAARLSADPRLSILGCRVRLIGTPGLPNSGMRRYLRWQNSLLDHPSIARDLFVESPFVHPSVMMRREECLGLGGYREFDGPEDYDLWLRAHARGLRFAKLAEPLLRWRDSPRRLTRSCRRYTPERFRALKLEALERGPLAGRPGVVIWGCGPIGKGWARALLARGHRVLAFVEVAPRRLGQVVHGARVVRPSEPPRGPLHLSAVAGAGARRRIRAAARRLGVADGRDLFAVA